MERAARGSASNYQVLEVPMRPCELTKSAVLFYKGAPVSVRQQPGNPFEEIPIRANELDTILPSQYLPARRKQAPEEHLMIAILHDAIDCVEKYRFATDTQGQRIFHEAKQWLLAHETEWPYSFECICGFLDLNAALVRQRLRIAPEQTLRVGA